MKIRILGAALLALCAFAVRRIHLLVHVPQAHPPTPAELVLGLFAILAGFAGAALLAVGPALFRAYAWPLPDADGTCLSPASTDRKSVIDDRF